ncbi:MAG: hypothetical protein QF903_12755 [Planctomycetota bacterium]|jgi:hypothetical protein|nr:hypothetical protein [Planctomycetota bacterium]MDP6990332.1 hypothetical protein [Planctomycetota bacterium]
MFFDATPGNALGCRTNAHRHGWDGNICDDATSWKCGIDQEFRERYCANGTARCFHLHIFDPQAPCLVIPDSGVGWILRRNPHALDDQILLIWAPEAEEPGGMQGGKNPVSVMAGAYRVGEVERVEHRNHAEWRIHPYPDSWTCMGPLAIPSPRFIHLDGPYIKQIDRQSIDRVFDAAREEEIEEDYWDAEDRERLENFAGHLDEWLTVAGERLEKLRAESGPPVRGKTKKSNERGVQQRFVRTQTPPAEPPARPDPLVEGPCRESVAATYGSETLTALEAGSLTHSLVVLTGAEGGDKGRLALSLIEDPRRERTLIVPVSPTWRGREDLLGRPNAAGDLFEPTALTRFLYRAQEAWDRGDPRPFVVLLEALDLGAPGHWLNELLTRAEFAPDQRADRTIDLGGQAVRGRDRKAGSSLFLSPAVRFVATLEAGLPGGGLSPRLLDRAAVIHLAIDPRTALERSGVELEPEQLDALWALGDAAGERGARFSLRQARSLKACLERLAELDLDSWGALDLVLRQEVLSKVTLRAADPADQGVQRALSEWSEGPGKRLDGCRGAISTWSELLESGRDVRLS